MENFTMQLLTAVLEFERSLAGTQEILTEEEAIERFFQEDGKFIPLNRYSQKRWGEVLIELMKNDGYCFEVQDQDYVDEEFYAKNYCN